ncbi:phospho-sugar mutase [Atopococcus tabaci]|uniref:phospho-sugar mutase n=1 Tax=Atopococcus tabaci TaxID=269774 RepID=UPI00040C3337|nr:phospho-sugar mutase [Atopococcus tabaci]
MGWKETYTTWKNHASLDEHVKKDFLQIENDEKALEDAFYKPLEFGTAGMRGVIGAGINRMNVYTVRQATEGLARFIEAQGEEAKQRGVAIAYDSRHFSPEFAMEAAKTLGAHGIKAYVFESLRPTPELSFAVRHLNAVSGIMVTASHNPPEYNGYKVYGEDGGQLPPKEADALTRYVRDVEDVLSIEAADEEELKEKGLLEIIGSEVDEAYLEEMKAVTVDPELVQRMGDKVKVVYTPLHGTGKMLGERALAQAGFTQVVLVPEQAEPDADFSTVKSPNPEDPEAFEYAIRVGKEEDADILIATDPDADRLGMAVKVAEGQYEVLTGNQIAGLMLYYILSAREKTNTLPKKGAVVKSIVSSEMATAIADKVDVKVFNVLTGFKFIAEKIKQFETDNSYEYLFGFEESYGYMVKPFVRDKDAIQALVLAAEMAASFKEKGDTCFDVLCDLYHEYGHFEEKTISVTLPGMEGAEKINQLMAQLREEAPNQFGDIEVKEVEDYKLSIRTKEDGTEETIDMPSADVLKYMMQDGSWIAVRPSGTEPKIKFYIGAYDDSGVSAKEKLQAFETSLREIVKTVE